MRGLWAAIMTLGGCYPEAFTPTARCIGDQRTGDVDRDGVCDDIDACPGTPREVAVDEVGCVLRTDTDLPADTEDTSPEDTSETDVPPDFSAETGDTDSGGGPFVDVVCGTPRVAGCREAHPRLGTLRYIPSGSFTMGCVAGRDDVAGGCDGVESPSRTVALTTPLWMMESELTQGQWTGLGFTNPSYFTTNGPNRPVERVNWWEALEAANEASRRDGLAVCYTLTECSTATSGTGSLGGGCTGSFCSSGTYTCTGVTITAPSGNPKDCEGWRLPTEAEWEYAARAGTSLPFSGGSDVNQVAWYDPNSGSETKAVCTTPTPRNAWGLCDLSGNVWEWTGDWYASDYNGAATTDPVGPASGSDRVVRGGSWGNGAQLVRVASRGGSTPGYRGGNLGFRLVRSVPDLAP